MLLVRVCAGAGERRTPYDVRATSHNVGDLRMLDCISASTRYGSRVAYYTRIRTHIYTRIEYVQRTTITIVDACEARIA